MDYSHVKLIVSDMDGTLLNDRGEVSSEFYELFQKLTEKNIRFVVASGRQYYSIKGKLEKIAPHLIFIAENGAIAIEGHKQLYLQPMQPKKALELITKIKSIGGGQHLIVSGTETAYIEDTHPEFLEQFHKHYEKYEIVENLTKAPIDEFLKITICDLSGAETNTYPLVRGFKDDFQVKLSGEIWIDFTHPKAHKGNALKKIQDLKGLKPENTMAFGDYLNDMELFDHAWFSFAMQNAHPKVKEAARFKTKSNNENGVEFILRKLLEN